MTYPTLSQPIKADTRLSDPGGMQGRVELVGLVTYRDGTAAQRRSPTDEPYPVYTNRT